MFRGDFLVGYGVFDYFFFELIFYLLIKIERRRVEVFTGFGVEDGVYIVGGWFVGDCGYGFVICCRCVYLVDF